MATTSAIKSQGATILSNTQPGVVNRIAALPRRKAASKSGSSPNRIPEADAPPVITATVPALNPCSTHSIMDGTADGETPSCTNRSQISALLEFDLRDSSTVSTTFFGDNSPIGEPTSRSMRRLLRVFWLLRIDLGLEFNDRLALDSSALRVDANEVPAHLHCLKLGG
jgi:hypothetical protein